MLSKPATARSAVSVRITLRLEGADDPDAFTSARRRAISFIIAGIHHFQIKRHLVCEERTVSVGSLTVVETYMLETDLASAQYMPMLTLVLYSRCESLVLNAVDALRRESLHPSP
ncbi:hypothetical protein E1301_Tti014047 [Triplophysa tibetana]|uniref:Uncharacterized protein n=1 Tax=Triplophysa tibetana TaxID=1572043 RepID=A0A5A9NDX5_9TELE|nr:hypothetical protein E1301_Tti014047 [Triplophysa tibetana]